MTSSIFLIRKHKTEGKNEMFLPFLISPVISEAKNREKRRTKTKEVGRSEKRKQSRFCCSFSPFLISGRRKNEGRKERFSLPFSFLKNGVERENEEKNGHVRFRILFEQGKGEGMRGRKQCCFLSIFRPFFSRFF